MRIVVGLALLAGLASGLPGTAGASTCFGTTADGALEGACRLAANGPNFEAYSSLGLWLGRTYVHCAVAEVVEAAYAALAQSHPEKVFVYGETGFASGGRFKPHKTHQNGLSVDFMVPVVDAKGRSVPLPTSPFEKFGYALEFDDAGRLDDLRIDFDALAAHLEALEAAAAQAGIGIWRVLFDPELQPLLKETASWPTIQGIQFSQRRSWVRHDEHYHVDFETPCAPRPPGKGKD